MANSASLHLFELISSMKRSEKRYFKIHIRTHSSKHAEEYVRLFGIVESQVEYDEAEVIKELSKKGISQRFAVLKHRLFDKVLDALESFQRSSDVTMQLRHEINRANVLITRGMTRAGETLLLKTQEQAIAIEAHEIALEVESVLYRAGMSTSESSEIKELSHQLLSNIEEEHELLTARTGLFRSLRSKGRLHADISIDTSIVEAKMLQCLEEKEAPKRVQYLANHSLAALRFAKNEIQASLPFVKECINILNSTKHIRDEFPMAQAEMWANETYINSRLHNKEAARKSLQFIIDTNEEGLASFLKIKYRGIVIQSLLFYLNGNEDELMKEKLNSELEFFEKERWSYDPEVRAGIDYGLGLYYHEESNRTKAMRCLNRVLNDGSIRRDEDIYHRTLVLATLLHVESGDREWMAHSARALKRYLKPRNLLGGVDLLLLNYISEHRRSRSSDGEHKALRHFADELRLIRKKPSQRVAFEHFDFLYWAESRLEGDHSESLVA